MIKSLRGAAMLAALLLPAELQAQEDTPKRPWTLQTDFGFVNTSGNTATTTLNAGQKATYTTRGWTIGQTFEAVYGRTDGATSAENYQARLRGDRALSSRFGIYALGGWERNKFAGISRRFEEGVGFTFQAVALKRTSLAFEAGVAANQQRSTLDQNLTFASGRAAVLLKQFLGEKAYLTHVTEVMPNFKQSDDLRITTETALLAPLSSQIAFKAGYVIRYDKLPQPTFETTDRYLTSGLQIVF